MTAGDALSYINDTKHLGSKLGLERISMLCGLLGNPQDSLPTVHVAGTNGKGSTAAMIAAALTAAGYQTGLYTSPYLVDARESIGIDGAQIADDEYAAIAAIVAEKARAMAADGEAPTSFELETAIAFLWFQRRQCDAAVIEVGLGGRLDATNVIRQPVVSVITSISYDHVNILGVTLAGIAAEKCGIIKPGGITVSYPYQDPEAMAVIRTQAEAAANRLILPDAASMRMLESGLEGSRIEYGGSLLHTPMIGRHQAWNAITAVEALRVLDGCGVFSIPERCIAEGIRKAVLPMRQEIISRNPLILLDGAHNLDKLAALAETIRIHLAGQQVVAVMGMLKDKQFEPSVALIAGLSHSFIACRPHSDRALDSETIASIARRHCEDVIVEDDVDRAVALAIRSAGQDGAVVVCGSFYLAGPARAALLACHTALY